MNFPYSVQYVTCQISQETAARLLLTQEEKEKRMRAVLDFSRDFTSRFNHDRSYFTNVPCLNDLRKRHGLEPVKSIPHG